MRSYHVATPEAPKLTLSKFGCLQVFPCGDKYFLSFDDVAPHDNLVTPPFAAYQLPMMVKILFVDLFTMARINCSHGLLQLSLAYFTIFLVYQPANIPVQPSSAGEVGDAQELVFTYPRGLEKFEFHPVLWARSSQILLALGHFLFVLVGDLVR